MAEFNANELARLIAERQRPQGQQLQASRDANGNYILNAGTKSERVVSPQEWEKMQAANTSPNASILSLQREGLMNALTQPQSGNNPTFASTVPVDYSNQIIGPWKNPDPSAFKSNPSLAARYAEMNLPARQMQQPQSAQAPQAHFDDAGGKHAGTPPSTQAPQARGKHAGTPPSTQAPQADFDDAGGKQAGTPPTTYSQTAPTASEFGASKVYKPTNYAAQTLEKLKSNPLFKGIKNIQNYLTDVIQKPESNKLTPEAQAAVDEYKAAVEKDKSALKDGMIYEQDGKQYVWNEKAGRWLEGKDIDKQSKAYQTVQTYNEIYKPYYNANKTALDNLKYLEQVSPIDNPIAQVIPLTEEFLAAKAKAQKEADNPTGMKEQDEAAAMIKQGAGPTDLEGKLRDAYGGYTTPEGMKAYQDALYESVAQRLRNEAGDLRSQQAADLASRGLGMSTVVNDVQAETNKRLLQGLGEAASRAAVGAEELRRGYLQDAQTLESGIANRGLQAGTQMSNVGAQKQNIYQSAQSPYMQAIQYQDANSLLNLSLQNQAWKDKVANALYLLNLPQQINAGQAGTQTNAANVGGKVYDANLQSAATQNETAGKVAAQIANAITPKTGYVPLQQVQGGFNGAVTGANAGFANPVKKTYTGQIAT